MSKYDIIKTNHHCKNCNKSLVRSNGRWKHMGFDGHKQFVCGNPQSKKRWNLI